MAFDNEVREELAKVQKNSRGEYIVVSKITNKVSGTVSGDVRLYYTNDSEEVAPTKKGCRFNAENAPEIVKGMLGLLEVDELETLHEYIGNLLDGEEGTEEGDTEEGGADDVPELTEDEEDGFMK